MEVLGLDDLEERIYRRLIDVPSSDAARLTRELGRRESAGVSNALSRLEQKGLVARSSAQPGQFSASPPALALGALIVERREELRQAELELGMLTDRYRGSAERTVTDVLDVVSGQDAVAQRFGQLQRGATSEVLAFVKSGVMAVSAAENEEAESAAVQRGVTFRVVLERGVLDQPGAYEQMAGAAERGERVRVANTVPIRMLIADRELGLLPLFGDQTATRAVGALLIHPSGLLDALVALFDLVYAAALPVLLPAGDGGDPRRSLDATDTRILSLLLSGLTDQAIGGHLQLSLRTVQRRVHALMQRAGVSTRLQLGYQAGRLGWVTPPDD